MIQVAHLTSVHPRHDPRIFVKMCSSLAESGFKTHLIVADGQGGDIKNNVQIHDVGPVLGGRVSGLFNRLSKVYRKAISLDLDIYHFHDPELMPVGVLLKVRGKKVIFDVHEDLPRQVLRKQWIPKWLRKPVSLFVHFSEFFTAKIVDAVVTVTPTIAKRFTNSKVIEARNYALLSEFENKSIMGVPKQLITYIGGITQDRGVLPMIAAFDILDARFTLGGKFQEDGLEEKAKSLTSWGKVDFIGWQSREQVSQLLESTLIGLVVLQPTGDYEDAFPVKMFEYMASGAAVIASDFPLWREIIDGAGCGICVDPRDPTAIAKAIDYLMNNKDLTLEMGKKGKIAVNKLYNWQSEFKKLETLYYEIYSN